MWSSRTPARALTRSSPRCGRASRRTRRNSSAPAASSSTRPATSSTTFSSATAATTRSSVSYGLSANVENLTLTGSAGIDATGNELNNILIGNSGNNTLDGGTGADAMAGSAGNDTYFVDNAGDVVSENAGEGVDTILSSVSYVTPANVENLTLTGNADINATGNELNNGLIGNSGNNVLDGGAGADTMTSST